MLIANLFASVWPDPALSLAPFGRRTLRDCAAPAV